jgi:hypothetical protein
MAKRKKTHVCKSPKHLPYCTKLDKRAYEWCYMDSHQDIAVKEKGYVKNKVKKEIMKDIQDMGH